MLNGKVDICKKKLRSNLIEKFWFIKTYLVGQDVGIDIVYTIFSIYIVYNIFSIYIVYTIFSIYSLYYTT